MVTTSSLDSDMGVARGGYEETYPVHAREFLHAQSEAMNKLNTLLGPGLCAFECGGSFSGVSWSSQ